MSFLLAHPHSPTRADERPSYQPEKKRAVVCIELEVFGDGYYEQMTKAKEIRDYINAKYNCEASVMSVEEEGGDDE
jgi:hypothetical protein